MSIPSRRYNGVFRISFYVCPTVNVYRGDFCAYNFQIMYSFAEIFALTIFRSCILKNCCGFQSDGDSEMTTVQNWRFSFGIYIAEWPSEGCMVIKPLQRCSYMSVAASSNLVYVSRGTCLWQRFIWLQFTEKPNVWTTQQRGRHAGVGRALVALDVFPPAGRP